MATSNFLTWLSAADASVPSNIAESTVAIIASRPTLMQHGTGTLFQLGAHSLVVTAGHVVSAARMSGATLGITGAIDHKLIAAVDGWRVSGSESDGHYPLDCAFYPLSEDQSARIDPKRFLTPADVGIGNDLSDAIFAFCAFPQVMSGTDDNELMKLRPLQFVSPAFEGSPVGIAALDERFHFLMAADDNYGWDASGREVTLRARSGLRVRIPDDLAGSSGCSVWKLGELTQPPGSFASSKLVGVLTGVYPKAGVIKATRWEAILELMCQAFLK